MAQPVWTLSVDLQTRTATFQSGMSEAAKAARSSFSEIKQGADEMGRTTSGSMGEARHGVMLLGEEFGVHLPRGLTTFIASLGPVGAAMEAAFPWIAIIVGATLLLKHLAKLKEEGEKLTESQIQFGTTVANVFNKLDEKLLESGIRTDELNHNHLAALHKQLELIDKQSMSELVQAFDTVTKAADLTMAQLKTSWYQFGAGAAGAKNALDEFKTRYDALLAQGKDKDANDLLAGTRQSAERVLALQKQAKDNQTAKSGDGVDHYSKYEQAANALKKEGIGFTVKEIEAQQTLVDALQAQVQVQEKVNALKASQKTNAVQTEQNKEGGDSDKAAREQAQQNKIAMEEAQKLWEENYREAVAKLQENEREKIDATRQGSAARLAAIDAAIKEEQGKGLQDTSFYRGLLTSRVQITREMTEEQNKLTAEAGKEGAEHGLKMGELQLAAQRDAAQNSAAYLRKSAQEQTAMKIAFAQSDYQLRLKQNEQEQAALDQTDKAYANKLKALQDRQLELTKEFENKKTEITEQAERKKAEQVIEAENRMGQAVAQTAARSIIESKSMSQAFAHLGSEMLQSALTNLLQMETVQGRKRFGDARTAAADAFEWAGNPLAGAIAAATTFAAVMAFETGGIVPGATKGDSVHAMLTPGEAVLPKQMTENLTHAARHGNGDGGTHHHYHMTFAPQVHAIDGPSVDRMLGEHADTFKKHFHEHLWRANR